MLTDRRTDRHHQSISRNCFCNPAKNGFRKKRSTVDQISSLTSIIENRKCKKLSTFTAFIDFKKAYDTIDRGILFNKLYDLGIRGRMYTALLSIYKDVKCCVRVQNLTTDWFNVKFGLKQGCLLSPHALRSPVYLAQVCIGNDRAVANTVV